MHALFQEIYEDHFTAQDDLAERIRALAVFAEGTLAGMIARSKVSEFEGEADAKKDVDSINDAELDFWDWPRVRLRPFAGLVLCP